MKRIVIGIIISLIGLGTEAREFFNVNNFITPVIVTDCNGFFDLDICVRDFDNDTYVDIDLNNGSALLKEYIELTKKDIN